MAAIALAPATGGPFPFSQAVWAVAVAVAVAAAALLLTLASAALALTDLSDGVLLGISSGRFGRRLIENGVGIVDKLRQLNDVQPEWRAARAALGRSYASDMPMSDGGGAGPTVPPVTPPCRLGPRQCRLLPAPDPHDLE